MLFFATFQPELQSCPHFGKGLQLFFGLPLPPQLSPCSIQDVNSTTNSLLFGFSQSSALGSNYSNQMLALLSVDPTGTNLSQTLSTIQPDPIFLRSISVQPGSPGSPPPSPSSFPLTTLEMIVIGGGVGILLAVLMVWVVIRSKHRKEERLRDAMTAMNSPMEERLTATGGQQQQQPSAMRKKTGRPSDRDGLGYVPPTTATSSPPHSSQQRKAERHEEQQWASGGSSPAAAVAVAVVHPETAANDAPKSSRSDGGSVPRMMTHHQQEDLLAASLTSAATPASPPPTPVDDPVVGHATRPPVDEAAVPSQREEAYGGSDNPVPPATLRSEGPMEQQQETA